MPNRDEEGVESCGGGRDGAVDQYPHLKHLSVAHKKKIWTSGRKTLLRVRSFREAWLWLVRGVGGVCDWTPVDTLIYSILLRAYWRGQENKKQKLCSELKHQHSHGLHMHFHFLESWAFLPKTKPVQLSQCDRSYGSRRDKLYDKHSDCEYSSIYTARSLRSSSCLMPCYFSISPLRWVVCCHSSCDGFIVHHEKAQNSPGLLQAIDTS